MTILYTLIVAESRRHTHLYCFTINVTKFFFSEEQNLSLRYQCNIVPFFVQHLKREELYTEHTPVTYIII